MEAPDSDGCAGQFLYRNTLNIFTKYVSVVQQKCCCFPLVSITENISEKRVTF